jgi:hypothetical protein
MNTDYREIEKKFIFNQRLDIASDLLEDFLNFCGIERSIKNCKTTDHYWNVAGGTFRIRDSHGTNEKGGKAELRELTFKRQDKGDTFDRQEYNANILHLAPLYAMFSDAFGKAGVLEKDETVFFLENKAVVSISKVNQDNFVYVEVEAPSAILVEEICKHLLTIFDMTRESRTLYELYIAPNSVVA